MGSGFPVTSHVIVMFLNLSCDTVTLLKSLMTGATKAVNEKENKKMRFVYFENQKIP